MSVFTKTFNIRFSFIIFCFLISTIFLLLILFIFDVLTGPKWSSIIPGLLTGFFIALFQAFLSWFELKKIDEYDALKIKKILPDRKDPIYYGDLISKSKREIIIQGVTALRFIDDFANKNKNVSEKEKVLLQALARNVNVKILIAHQDFLNNGDKGKAEEAEIKLNDLSSNINFEYKYYAHHPTHSIVIIDDECIVGPIFPDVNSRDTPAIHLKRDSQLAKYYEDYFNSEWEECIKKKTETTG